MASKFVLEVEPDYDFSLLGICSHEKDYRISWAINNELGISLQRTQDLELTEKKKGMTSGFSMYSYNDEEKYREYYILANRNGSSFLLPEQKQADYFLLIRSSPAEEEKQEILEKIKRIGLVLTAYEIMPLTLKSRQNLLF